MSKRKKEILMLFSLILLNIGIFSRASIADLSNVPRTSNTGVMENVIIDGVINEDEWSDADWNIEFYLDLDNSGANVDGYNYMYLGEDEINFYVALDLCGDQSNDETGEWIGLWINTMNRDFGNKTEWAPYIDDGAETLIHDVEHNKTWLYFKNDTYIAGNLYKYINGNEEINAIIGSAPGDYINTRGLALWDMISEQIGSDYSYRIDFSINMTKWFDVFPHLYLPMIKNMTFDFEAQCNTTITEQKIVFWYDNGTMNVNDPDQVKPLGTGTGLDNRLYDYGLGNITDDDLIQFSIIANHSSSFTTEVNWIRFDVTLNKTNVPGVVGYPYSSIKNYNIDWSFGISSNNNSAHRMFEFSIPKSELEHYDSNEDLGILISGYGTATFEGTNLWCYSKVTNYMWYQNSSMYLYYNMKGCEVITTTDDDDDDNNDKDAVVVQIPGYEIGLIIGMICLISVLIIKNRKI